jgi:hypothetical protein
MGSDIWYGQAAGSRLHQTGRASSQAVVPRREASLDSTVRDRASLVLIAAALRRGPRDLSARVDGQRRQLSRINRRAGYRAMLRHAGDGTIAIHFSVIHS